MKKEKNNITKDILSFLLLTGGISLILTNPAFLAPAILLARYSGKNFNNKKGSYSISYLKRNGLISISKKGKKTYVSLSKKGKRRAQTHQMEIDLLARKESLKKKNWSGKWYIVAFDITGGRRIKRDALRNILRRSGFILLQKSVWISPIDCRKEIEFVKDFLNIKDEGCRVITSCDIGDDKKLKKYFKLN